MKAVADRKKAEHIGEYLIYMYQMEDLIRSYQGNMEDIFTYVISHYPVSEEEKQEIRNWFEEILRAMQEQRILEKGHLRELHEVVGTLLALHYSLLKTDEGYVQLFHRAKPHLFEAIEASGEEPLGNEIQICLNGVYGLLLNRLLGKHVGERQLQAAEAFGSVLGRLNFSYQQKIFLSTN